MKTVVLTFFFVFAVRSQVELSNTLEVISSSEIESSGDSDTFGFGIPLSLDQSIAKIELNFADFLAQVRSVLNY